MRNTVDTWDDFRARWNRTLNFLMEGECVPFDFAMPPIARVLEAARFDADANIGSGAKGRALERADMKDSFRALSIDDALQASFSLAHFKLPNFYGAGQMLEGFGERVMEPWQAALAANGFTWRRCYPILFISGAGCATNYHMDYSHVLAWQIGGTKTFSGLKDPDRWADLETRVHSTGVQKPAAIADDDVLSFEMTPGTTLWNCFLTPHWVEASDEVSYSINISHGGLRLDGELCRHEKELEQWRGEHPEDANIGLF